MSESTSPTPGESIEKIRAAMAGQTWETRIPALEEARNLVLQKYQMFPHLSRLIAAQPEESRKKVNLTIPPYRRSTRAFWHRAGYKLKKKLGMLEPRQ